MHCCWKMYICFTRSISRRQICTNKNSQGFRPRWQNRGNWLKQWRHLEVKEASEKTGMVQFTPADCMAGRTRNVRSILRGSRDGCILHCAGDRAKGSTIHWVATKKRPNVQKNANGITAAQRLSRIVNVRKNYMDNHSAGRRLSEQNTHSTPGKGRGGWGWQPGCRRPRWQMRGQCVSKRSFPLGLWFRIVYCTCKMWAHCTSRLHYVAFVKRIRTHRDSTYCTHMGAPTAHIWMQSRHCTHVYAHTPHICMHRKNTCVCTHTPHIACMPYKFCNNISWHRFLCKSLSVDTRPCPVFTTKIV